jgi:tol-pal system protein YbgF
MSSQLGEPACPSARFANKWGQMADDQNEKPQVVRFPEPGVEPARDAEERRRVAEIACEIEELGRALEGRDRLSSFGTAERAESSPVQAGQSAGGVGDRSTPEPEPLPTVADISIPAIPQQRKLVAEGGAPTRRRKWGPSLAAVIIVLSLVSGGALMLMAPPIEIAQDAYRSAVAEMQRLTARENAETEAAARKAAEEKALAEEAERKAAEEKLAAVAAARRHEEEARQAAEEKAKAEAAAREMAEAEARAAAQEAAKRQAAEEKAKAEAAARQMAEAEARAAAQSVTAATPPSARQPTPSLPLPSATEAKLLLPPPNATAPLPSPVAVVPAATPQPSPVVAAPVVPTAPVSAVATPGQSELSPSEIVEVQTRLEALGMKPGRLDGILGSRTIGAIKRYEEANGLPQTGNIDREILGRLRQEKPVSQAESASRKAAAPSAASGADQMYNDAFKKLQDGDYADAERGFKAFLQSNPRHVLAGNAQYWLGETYYARRDYKNAMTAFADGYEVYKASPKGPDNLLKLGVTLAVLGRKPDACAVFAKFNQDYPRAIDLQKRRVEQERQKNGCG